MESRSVLLEVPAAPTVRALATGVALGALLAIANLYMGLKTGWWETGTVTASVMALMALSSVGARDALARDATYAQTLATAAGAAPATAGLLAAIPALSLGAHAAPFWAVAVLALGAGAAGIALAAQLRRRLLDEDALPFPSGVAAAELVRAASSSEQGSGSGRAVLLAGAISAAVTWVRDGPRRLLPALVEVPGAVAGVPSSALGLGVALSPMLLGVGALVGVATALAVLGGAALAWIGVAPALVRAGAVPEASYGALAGWLLWPGAGVMLGGAVVSLAADLRAFRGGVGDLRAAWRAGSRRARALAAGGALAVAAALALGASALGLAPAAAPAAILAAAVAATACARAAGASDVAPVGELGQLVQAAAAPLGSAAGIAAGQLAAGVAAQASVSLWSLRAGEGLGVSPSRQSRLQLAGLALGVAVAIPAYAVLARGGALGGPALPVPAAARWRALAEVAGAGGAALPPGALPATLAALAVGALLELAGRKRPGRVPAPGALGLGFVLPFHAAAAIGLGALAAAIGRARGPGTASRLLAPAAGAIAGESLAALAASVLAALRG